MDEKGTKLFFDQCLQCKQHSFWQSSVALFIGKRLIPGRKQNNSPYSSSCLSLFTSSLLCRKENDFLFLSILLLSCLLWTLLEWHVHLAVSCDILSVSLCFSIKFLTCNVLVTSILLRLRQLMYPMDGLTCTILLSSLRIPSFVSWGYLLFSLNSKDPSNTSSRFRLTWVSCVLRLLFPVSCFSLLFFFPWDWQEFPISPSCRV